MKICDASVKDIDFIQAMMIWASMNEINLKVNEALSFCAIWIRLLRN